MYALFPKTWRSLRLPRVPLAALLLMTSSCASLPVPENSGRLLGIPNLPEFSSVLNSPLNDLILNDPPISTSFADTDKNPIPPSEFPERDFASLHSLPRGPNGGFLLQPGAYELTVESYCLKAGTYGPSRGNGYLYAPLKGSQANIVRSILKGVAAHPEIKQNQVQSLLWAVQTKAKINRLSPELQRVAASLLTEQEIYDLNGGALGLIPQPLLEMAISRIPPELRRIYRLQAELRRKLTETHSNFAELERIAVLTGVPPQSGTTVPERSWSAHPGGFFVRYLPQGSYRRNTIQVYVPKKELALPSYPNNEASLKKASLVISQNAPTDSEVFGENSENGEMPSSSSTLPYEYDPADDVAVPGNSHSQRIGFQSQPPSGPNTVPGTCKDFADHVNKIGAVDPSGKGKPGRAGFTDYDFKFHPRYPGATATVQHLEGGSFKACEKVKKIIPHLSARKNVEILKWTPDPPISRTSTCFNEYDKWTKAVQAHEEEHKNIVDKGVKEWNRDWNSKSYLPGNAGEVCSLGHSRKDARRNAHAQLNREVNSHIKSELRKLRETLNKRHDLWHKDPRSKVAPLECKFCP